MLCMFCLLVLNVRIIVYVKVLHHFYGILSFAFRAIPFEILRGAEWKKIIKNMWGVGEKIKISEGGSAKFSIPPPLRISNRIALLVN